MIRKRKICFITSDVSSQIFEFPDDASQFCRTNSVNMKENDKEKFLRLCSMIGSLEHPDKNPELLAELRGASTNLDNLFYAGFGMSAEEILSVIR